MKEEDSEKSMLTEKYKHFKGIYIERTQQYFLCDFYEVQYSNGLIAYRIHIDLNNSKEILELFCNDDGNWNYVNKDRVKYPTELEQALSEYIIACCINNMSHRNQ